MLSINAIDVFYKEIQAIWGVSMVVNEGELVALVGPNGSGKTTILRVISGLLKPASGSLEFLGKSLKNLPPHRVVELGISQVPETGKIFTEMTVFENLELGAFLPAARKERFQTIKWVYEIFPRLEERKDQMAGTLSGGERQMLAIGRALMSKPKLLLLDEPSFGLAPIMVENMFEMIARINKQGVTILLVEQNVQAALELAQRAYLLENGKIVGGGKASELLSFESVRSAYLGDAEKGGKHV
jgi:branched-chain amino acid transport system ATP-binding protein